MNPGNDIVKELQELGSPLAAFSRAMPYAVPEGYFAVSHADPILSATDPVLNLPRTMPFELPEGYFAGLDINKIIQLAEAETETPAWPKAMPFSLPPAGYFEAFAASILDKVEKPAMGMPQAAPFEMPVGYFDGFADRMLAAAKAAETVGIRQTKVVDFRPTWQSVRWAAAAMLVIALGVGSFLKFSGESTQPAHYSAARQLAQLDKSLIRSYVEQHIDEFDTDMLADNSSVINKNAAQNIDKLREQDIRQYLEDGDLGDSGLN